MSKPITNEVLPKDLREHRAVVAWNQLMPGREEPAGIEILKLRNKSAVYRIAGIGPGGSAVIAKRCLTTTARTEYAIHEEFLARLPIGALHCYGFLKEETGDFCWLFLEEATGEPYSPLSAGHRALAGSWLATIHAAAAGAGLESRLPARNPVHYLNLLKTSRGVFLQHLYNSELVSEDHRALEAMVAHCDAMESRWSEVEDRCANMPRTLVHGDFVIKNVRVRALPDVALLVFDWEAAAWGIPATDFAQFTGRTLSPDLTIYYSAMTALHYRPDLQAIQLMAEYGKLFRLIDDMHWVSQSMSFDTRELLLKPISYLMSYDRRMVEALKAMNWTRKESLMHQVAP
jgi:hypothetical protein